MTIKSVKNVADKSIKFAWKKVSNVSGYEAQISKKKDFSNNTETVTIRTVSRTSITFFGLEKKKNYYVRIRCFNEYISGKTSYSKWSEVKKIKVVK